MEERQSNPKGAGKIYLLHFYKYYTLFVKSNSLQNNVTFKYRYFISFELAPSLDQGHRSKQQPNSFRPQIPVQKATTMTTQPL